jgi:hypothetical protein
VLRRAQEPMTARQTSDALLAGKTAAHPGSKRKPYRRPFLLRCGSGTARRWLVKVVRRGGY